MHVLLMRCGRKTLSELRYVCWGYGRTEWPQSLGGEEDRNLKLKKSRFKLDDNMGNGDGAHPAVLANQSTVGTSGIQISHGLRDVSVTGPMIGTEVRV